ncbi:protein FAR-RED IMPAIRED RESPONSE 1-like [Telopea speciosissima]|uniref:protein FAR-RED IMPAIRED RESPONSE 1-like n=1 Tax=Telopea speciosissima TaxID=54955 RepID=UPI001CC39C0E|nr:protein FAR-RED IMPAIRED RESPONSE 1-like [Telopea speciosissima]
MGRQAGGRQNIGYIPQDHHNYLRSKRQRDLIHGEASSLLQYFTEQSRLNPFFSYAVQLDTNEHVTNIFWADARMIIDYALFDNVVTFDTTFCTNKENRSFGIFAGFNHHRGVVAFGAALLYDETVESFNWLFEAFLESHGKKKPITIFTDQDAAMAKAISEVFHGTWHGLCTWHLMQNAIKHLGNLMKNGSSFLSDLNKCVYQYVEEVKFESAWEELQIKYGVENNPWLNRMYGLKEKWARSYMNNAFTSGMRSTQLSESLNADLKDYTKSILDVVQFFKHFERVVNDKRAKELKVDFDARNKLPKILFSHTKIIKHAEEVYTPTIFNLFQDEYSCVGDCYIKWKNESSNLREYIVGILDQEMEFKVECNPSESVIQCNCRKFETFGILCCHALKGLDLLDIKCIPKAYILRRWTLAARSMVIEYSREKEVVKHVNLDSTKRSTLLCRKLVKLASQASNSTDGYDLVNNAATDLFKQLDNLVKDAPHQAESTEEPNLIIAKGLKKKEKKKREGKNTTKRYKSCLETQGKSTKSP